MLLVFILACCLFGSKLAGVFLRRNCAGGVHYRDLLREVDSIPFLQTLLQTSDDLFQGHGFYHMFYTFEKCLFIIQPMSFRGKKNTIQKSSKFPGFDNVYPTMRGKPFPKGLLLWQVLERVAPPKKRAWIFFCVPGEIG